MLNMQTLNPLACPLSGINLIEASAGTGKTWTIAALFNRLLLEGTAEGRFPTIDQILVVTYTKAATAELRDRLRKGLVDLKRTLLAEKTEGLDPFLLALRERYLAQSPEAQTVALVRIDAAIREFDQAAIYTIHGFCQRMLKDAAFEGGQAFESELVADNRVLQQEIVEDFWRRHVVNNAEIAKMLVKEKATPETWLKELAPYFSKPYLKFPSTDMATFYLDCKKKVEVAWQWFKDNPAEVGKTLEWYVQPKELDGSRIKKVTRQKLIALIPQFLSQDLSPVLRSFKSYEHFEKLGRKLLSTRLKGEGTTLPDLEFLDRMDDFLSALEDYQLKTEQTILDLKIRLIHWVDEETARRRQVDRQRSFDDLLTDFQAALADKNTGEKLAKQVAEQFQVALIDEFQDTDPIQYAIFHACFIKEQLPVFLVGDPKQAIYGFRGADIYAYLQARGDAIRHYSLETNRRSVPNLVEAVNHLFSRPNPFVMDSIAYHPVKFETSPKTQLEDASRPANAASFIFLGQSEQALQDPLANNVDFWAADITAEQIACLLKQAIDGKLSVKTATGSRPVMGGDIAVLVSMHIEGDAVRDQLKKRGIPSVALTQANIYESAEAKDVLALMKAWAKPRDESHVRYVLATELMGYDAYAIQAINEDEAQWETLLNQLVHYQEVWIKEGFMSAWRQFFAQSHLAERVLPLLDGERRLTNYWHIAELIQQESEVRSGIQPLLSWLEDTMSGNAGGEESLLRLESDANLVKIATIHASKGLQYPIVFCPFLWKDRISSKISKPFFQRLHDESCQAYLAVTQQLDEKAQKQCHEEYLSEQLRLLYVALTRAQCRIYLPWVAKDTDNNSIAMNWLLSSIRPPMSAPVEKEKKSDAENGRLRLDYFALMNQLQRSPLFQVNMLDQVGFTRNEAQQSDQASIEAKVMQRKVYTPWWMTSFTHLSRGRQVVTETPAPVSIEEETGRVSDVSAEVGEVSRFTFPKGKRPGICLHAILEKLSFSENDSRRDEVISHTLSRFGFSDEIWHETIIDMADSVLKVPLDEGVYLKNVPMRHRLNEMAFTQALGRLNVEHLKAVLTDPDNGLHPNIRQAAQRLDFATVHGYLTGVMDLVANIDGRIYLIDYKSNFMGNQLTDYESQLLVHEVAQSQYALQYLIYTLALSKYFSARGVAFWERFAGVRYLFLRGLDQEGRGVWADQPSEDLIQHLDAVFSGRAAKRSTTHV